MSDALDQYDNDLTRIEAELDALDPKTSYAAATTDLQRIEAVRTALDIGLQLLQALEERHNAILKSLAIVSADLGDRVETLEKQVTALTSKNYWGLP